MTSIIVLFELALLSAADASGGLTCTEGTAIEGFAEMPMVSAISGRNTLKSTVMTVTTGADIVYKFIDSEQELNWAQDENRVYYKKPTSDQCEIFVELVFEEVMASPFDDQIDDDSGNIVNQLFGLDEMPQVFGPNTITPSLNSDPE